MTIYDATFPVNGTNRTLVAKLVGFDGYYMFKRPQPFPNGMAQTLPMWVSGMPVVLENDVWVHDCTRDYIIRAWSEKIEESLSQCG